MKICVFGAGAIGGYFAASLARASEHEISAVARGSHLAAIKANGLTVRVDGTEWRAPVRSTDNTAELGTQDIVVVTLKAPAIPGAVESLRALIKADTTFLFALNGIPWWYYYRHGGPHDGEQIARLDPGGKIWSEVGPQRALGGVIYCSSTVVSPGVLSLDYADVKLEIGEPDGSDSARLKTMIDALMPVGTVIPTNNIRQRIWAKLVLNMATGPSAVLSQTALGDIVRQQGMRDEIEAMIKEAMAIAAAAGAPVELDIAAAVAKIAKSAHKPSILQDFEAGRPMEVESLYGIPLEIGRAAGVRAPKFELLTTLVKTRARI